MLKIRPLAQNEIPLLKDFAPPEWNTDLSATFAFHFGQPYFYPIAAELDGEIVGCAQGLLNGRVGWLGNIIVLPLARGQGIGGVLTQHLVDFFRARGCANQLLIATSMGEPVYRKLGFVETSRYIFLKRTELIEPKTIPNIRRANKEEFSSILALDQEATGEKRAPFLCRFFANAWVYIEKPSAKIEGFYLSDLRDGPVIARAERAGLALLEYKLSMGKTLLVAPKDNAVALEFLKAAGFAEVSSAPRMALGGEVGWKPEWVFSRGAGYCG